MKTFQAPTKLILEADAADALAEVFANEGWKRPAVVVDAGLRKAGTAAPVLEALERIADTVTIFEVAVPEPDIDFPDTVAASFRAADPDVIVGLGGGTSMDLAKAAAVLLTNEGKAEQYQGFALVEKPGLPSVMIPTTAGTGSEVTWTAVYTNPRTKKKLGINSPYLLPKYAVLDAKLTLSMPRSVTASTGMDALTHAIESYSANNRSSASITVSERAFELLFTNLGIVLRDGSDLAARSAMLLGSTTAGWAILNAGTGACHSVAYALGTHCKVPHGVANTMLLPRVMRVNDVKSPGVYAGLWDRVRPADHAKTAAGKSLALIEAIESTLAEAGIAPRLADYGVSDTHVDFLAEQGLGLASALSNNPVEFGMDDARAVLRDML